MDIFEKVDSIIVSWDFSDGHEILIIGKKNPGKDIDILNAFQGDKAKDIYTKIKNLVVRD